MADDDDDEDDCLQECDAVGGGRTYLGQGGRLPLPCFQGSSPLFPTSGIFTPDYRPHHIPEGSRPNIYC